MQSARISSRLNRVRWLASQGLTSTGQLDDAAVHASDRVYSGTADGILLHFAGDEGHRDGAICDAEGGVWIAQFGGWAARRYAPDGRQTDEVRLPVANITKIALGGPDGRTAFATTARQGLSTEARAAQPLAGDVFIFPVEIPGVPVVPANS